MKSLLKVEVLTLDNGSVSVNVDANIDRYAAIGFLEEAKYEILKQARQSDVKSSVPTLPSLSPKRF